MYSMGTITFRGDLKTKSVEVFTHFAIAVTFSDRVAMFW